MHSRTTKNQQKARSNAKQHALKHRTDEHKMNRTSVSKDYCRHCGKETSRSTRHESGHREFDHVDAPNSPISIKG